MMLNIKDALKLYSLVGEFVPDPEDYGNFFDFIGKIVVNMDDAKVSDRFVDVILLTHSNMTIDDLLELDVRDTIKLFMDGLAENKILSLIQFCEALGYGG